MSKRMDRKNPEEKPKLRRHSRIDDLFADTPVPHANGAKGSIEAEAIPASAPVEPPDDFHPPMSGETREAQVLHEEMPASTSSPTVWTEASSTIASGYTTPGGYNTPGGYIKPGDSGLATGAGTIHPADSFHPGQISASRPIGATGLTTTASYQQNRLQVEVEDEENPLRAWSEDEVLLVEQVTDQLSLALQNAQLFQESRKRAEQLAILNEMSRKLSEQLDVEQVCQTIYSYTIVLMPATVFYIAINLKESNEVYFPIWAEVDTETGVADIQVPRRTETRRPYSNGLTEFIFNTGQTILIDDNVEQFMIENLGSKSFGQPARSWLGVPMVYSDQVIGMISLQDYVYPNVYNEEHRDLLSAIANQAAVAIQNARLYTEEQHRRQIADGLSDIARTVSTQLNVRNISEQMLDQLYNLVPYDSASLQLIETGGKRLTIARRGASAQRPEAAETFDRPIADDPLIREAVESRQAILLSDTLEDPRWEVYPETEGIRSWIAAPLVAGEEVVGLLIVDHHEPQAYNRASVELLSTVSAQVAVAIQNARLFQQTRSAFSALEVSERYQKSVAQATSVLTERGIAALGDVLETLGEAARASRAYYFETQVDQRGTYWRLIAEWHAPGIPPQINNPALRHLSTRFIAPWIDQLRADGKISTPVSELAGGIRQFFEPLGTKSVLQFAVQGRHEIPGCIGFEQLETPRAWTEDEISALQTAASALQNTISREDLFTQVQINLAETEALYQASARLNSAASYDDILTVLRQHSILGHMNASNVSIHLFDRPWTTTDKPEWLIPIARWIASPIASASTNRSIYAKAKEPAPGTGPLNPASLTYSRGYLADNPPEDQASIGREHAAALAVADSLSERSRTGLHNRYSISEWSTVEQLLHPDRATVVSDIASDPRIDETGRKIYAEQMNAKSLLYVPLNVAGRWIGTVIAIYRLTTGFPEHEIRRLMSLAGQGAIAVQNLNLLEEASRRARQLQTAAEIARDTSGTLALEALLNRAVNLVQERFDYYHASVFLIEEDEEGAQQAVIYESTGSAGEEMKQRRHHLAVGSRSVVGQVTLTGHPIVLNDVEEPSSQATHRPNPLLPETKAELGLPLRSGERVIGALDVQASRTNAFPPEDIAVLQTLADQLSVAVENARSYTLVRQAAEELREADRLKSQFLANMSHELRTPLNSIIGFSRVILKGIDGPVNELQSQDLTAIYNSGQHLLGLINDVLDVSKIEAGKMELAFEDGVHLSDIVRGVMSTTVGLVKDKPVELHQELDPDLPPLRIDTMKVRQVLINLLSNAAKFTEKGSITVRAFNDLSPEGQPQVMVQVIDTGPGIAESDQTKLFQPFSQVDGSLTRKTGGSGLGLSICQHLIHMHGGQIGLESELGKGSTFFFTLPVIQPAEPKVEKDTFEVITPAMARAEMAKMAGKDQSLVTEQPSVTDQPPVTDPLPETNPPAEEITEEPPRVEEAMEENAIQLPEEIASGEAERPALAGGLILAADKDPQVIDVYKRWLAGLNFTVIALTELQQLTAVARGLQPVAITLDTSMQTSGPTPTSIIDGWAVLKELKNDPGTRHIPVIICSLQSEVEGESAQERALQMGAAEYLLKPILEDDLLHALQRLQANNGRNTPDSNHT
jgi:GAF domain-containing protein/FixJ family two-component response regulator